MRCGLILAAATCIVGSPAGAVQGARVAGHITIREKGNKPSPDLGAAVAYLEATAAGAPAPPHAMTFDIAINDKEFVPRVVVVPVGSTVRFPNHDPFNHNVFSVSESNSFDLGLYGRGEAKGYTVATPGLARVFCNIHPRMVAFVQVMATRLYAQPAADGAFAIDNVPPGRYVLHVWHERSAAATQDLTVGPGGVAELRIELDARGFRPQAHKNKYGEDYPTNDGRERY
jgi:plastocyanin